MSVSYFWNRNGFFFLLTTKQRERGFTTGNRTKHKTETNIQKINEFSTFMNKQPSNLLSNWQHCIPVAWKLTEKSPTVLIWHWRERYYRNVQWKNDAASEQMHLSWISTVSGYNIESTDSRKIFMDFIQSGTNNFNRLELKWGRFSQKIRTKIWFQLSSSSRQATKFQLFTLHARFTFWQFWTEKQANMRLHAQHSFSQKKNDFSRQIFRVDPRSQKNIFHNSMKSIVHLFSLERSLQCWFWVKQRTMDGNWFPWKHILSGQLQATNERTILDFLSRDICCWRQDARFSIPQTHNDILSEFWMAFVQFLFSSSSFLCSSKRGHTNSP